MTRSNEETAAADFGDDRGLPVRQRLERGKPKEPKPGIFYTCLNLICDQRGRVWSAARTHKIAATHSIVADPARS
jgi:hypothetical protein